MRLTTWMTRASSLTMVLLVSACGSPAAPSPSSTAAVASSGAVSTRPPDPTPAQLIAIGSKGNVLMIAPTKPPATATPDIGAGAAYRMEGVVVDESGTPLADVCIAIGPNGCQVHSPRTDARGVYFIDFPAAEVDYDLHFTKDGFKEFDQRLKPTRSTVLNIVLGQ
ncbi:MAG TPA: carboxypeptidase-like regulatory domain-containing protein [Verrucomicrobiae bacterium]|nr:carboxypeptidase-like regulatory domain-containing protein [Verrucomicrobiae bacterium]